MAARWSRVRQAHDGGLLVESSAGSPSPSNALSFPIITRVKEEVTARSADSSISPSCPYIAYWDSFLLWMGYIYWHLSKYPAPYIVVAASLKDLDYIY